MERELRRLQASRRNANQECPVEARSVQSASSDRVPVSGPSSGSDALCTSQPQPRPSPEDHRAAGTPPARGLAAGDQVPEALLRTFARGLCEGSLLPLTCPPFLIQP